MNEALLTVEGLSVRYERDAQQLELLQGMSFAVKGGETLGIVGESGSGKSLTALALMDLLAPNLVAAGSIKLKARELTGLPRKSRRRLCGRELAMVFQDPMTALNPVYTVGRQISEVLLTHGRATRRQAWDRAVELLRQVGIPHPEQRVSAYPHQMSGGMRQRVVIAIALAGEPSVLIADEPTTALDVTVQAQVLELFRDLRSERGMATLLISHDLGVIAEAANHVLVLYAGRVVEQAPVEALFTDPQHPYTIGLLSALPKLGPQEKRLSTIDGRVPLAGTVIAGCRFADRCPFVVMDCRTSPPPLRELPDGRRVACIRAPLPVPAPMEVAR